MKYDTVIQEGVTEIKEKMFYNNHDIVSVTLPNTVKKIGEQAFQNCRNLVQVNMCEGLTEIGSFAFCGCENLESITLPDSVDEIGVQVFYKTNLKKEVMNFSGNILFYCPHSIVGKEWYVPDKVKVIKHRAFMDCDKVEIIHLPAGLEKIEWNSFYRCGIKEITIPASVKIIESCAFEQCTGLEKVIILGSDTKIEDGAFIGSSEMIDIISSDSLAFDKQLHMQGILFSICSTKEKANLNHTSNIYFKTLALFCGKGNSDAMNELADFFTKYSQKIGASDFYMRAANYWRYRAYRKGNIKAKHWFENWFLKNQFKRMDSVLPESLESERKQYNFSVSGKLMNDLGFAFFDSETDYTIRYLEKGNLVEACSYDGYDEPDEDGFGMEEYYNWYYLDENMQPIPNVPCYNGSRRDRTYDERYKTLFQTAVEYVSKKST